MPFRNSKTLYYQNIPKEICEERSKIRSTFKGILPLHDTSLFHAERASVFASSKGSITVEAAMAVPLFFFAVVSLLYLMEIMAIQISVRASLQYAGKEIAGKAYPVAVVSCSEISEKVVNAIGAQRLERSIVEGGSSGIDCSQSIVSTTTGIGELSVKYKIRIPVPIFRIAVLPYEETMRIKTWTGYEKSVFGTADNTIVYITDTGLVYHKDYHCTYLELSIRMVQEQQLSHLRNADGGKYYACERCKGYGNGRVYITENGDRYHNTLSCCGLKRTIYAVRISEAAGKRPCSKCSGS